MSKVTTVVLFCPSSQENVDAIQKWLSDHEHGELKQLNDYFGGHKAPEIEAYGVACNHLDDRGLAAFFSSLTWRRNEEVLLVMNPQANGVLTYRPLPNSRLSAEPNRVGS